MMVWTPTIDRQTSTSRSSTCCARVPRAPTGWPGRSLAPGDSRHRRHTLAPGGNGLPRPRGGFSVRSSYRDGRRRGSPGRPVEDNRGGACVRGARGGGGQRPLRPRSRRRGGGWPRRRLLGSDRDRGRDGGVRSVLAAGGDRRAGGRLGRFEAYTPIPRMRCLHEVILSLLWQSGVRDAGRPTPSYSRHSRGICPSESGERESTGRRRSPEVEGSLSHAGGVLWSSRLGTTVLLSCLQSLRWGAWGRKLAL